MKPNLSLTLLCLLICSAIVVSEDLTKDVDSYIRSRNVPTKFSGDVLIGRENKIIFHKSYGMADYENDVPISHDTLFRIGSLTKPLTAVAILILQKQSRLNTNDTIDRYIANIPEEWKKVKIHRWNLNRGQNTRTQISIIVCLDISAKRYLARTTFLFEDKCF